jgi:dTDP-4-amino-4,6-dideoxygalactose transaminase
LVDVDPDTIAMTPADLERAIRQRPETRAVIPVHIAGLAQDMSAIRKIVGTRTIIEDASHALGAFYANGRPVGCCDDTDMAVFSFHPVKPITTGEGGMITTNDDELARRLRLLRNHGIERAEERFVSPGQADPDGEGTAPWYQEQQVMGFNFRMSDIHAALGLSQLHKLDEFIARRREIAYYYDAEFSSLKHVRPLHAAPADRDRSSLHLYVVDVDFEALGVSRTSFVNALRKWNVGTQIHYLPVYRHPYHRAGGAYAVGMFPGAERYHRGCLSLPLFQGLASEEANRVVAAIRDACGA